MRYKNPTPNPLPASEEGAYSDFRVNEPHFISHAISLRDPEG
jgi:hypothetical protein